MVPTSQNSIMSLIMQQLGMMQPDAGQPGGPPGSPPPGQQPGAAAFAPISMPTQAPPDLRPGAQPMVAPIEDAKAPAALPPMGVPYAAPSPQREASMTQDAGRGPMPAAPAAPARAMPEPSFMDNLAQFVSGMRTGGAITDLAGGYKAVQGRNATREFLTQKGVAPETISAMEADPRIYQPVMADLFSSKTQVINNMLVDSKTGRVVADFSDTAIKGPKVEDAYDAAGNRQSVVFNPRTKRFETLDGQPVKAGETPPGIPPNSDPKTYRETTARKMAEDQVKAQTNLPEALRASKFLIDKIDDVLGDGDLGRVTGFVGGNVPNMLPGAVNAQAKIDQLKGQAFLQAYQTLKGSGSISDKEGAKAEAAQARLSAQKVGTEQYKTALREFRQEVTDLRELAERKARGDYTPLAADMAAPPKAPDPAAETKRAEAGATDIVEGTKIRNPRTGQELTWRGGKWVQ